MNKQMKRGKTLASNRDEPQKPESLLPRSSSGLPGGGAGRRDIVERIPDDVHVDPCITEGNPDYEESGGSEIIPPQRLKSDEAKAAGRRASASPRRST